MREKWEGVIRGALKSPKSLMKKACAASSSDGRVRLFGEIAGLKWADFFSRTFFSQVLFSLPVLMFKMRPLPFAFLIFPWLSCDRYLGML